MSWDPEVQRCFKCLADQFDADDVYAEFQAEDSDGNGVLKLRDFIHALSVLLGEGKDVDVHAVADAFAAAKKHVNYTKFCHGLQEFTEERAKASKDETSPDDQRPTVRRQLKHKAAASGGTTGGDSTDRNSSDDHHSRVRPRKAKSKQDPDSDVTKRTIRVDHRLEKHRVLKTAIRHKILLGVKKSTSHKEGFDGIRDTLLREDDGGDGTLDEHVFVESLLTNMKSPLTKKEMAYLTLNLRNKRHPSCINYEQIGHFLCVDSEEEASTSGDEATNHPLEEGAGGRNLSPSKRLELDQPHLGSDILSVERDLKTFLNQRVPRSLDGQRNMSCCHIPRSIFTGAEKFLEACEVYDPLEVGALPEDGYEKALNYCGMAITHAQLRSVLTKFPRDAQGLISYIAFLERYDQHYANVKHRKQMKVILQRLATDPERDASIHLTHFRRQLEKVDGRVTGALTGILSKKDFTACLTNHSSLKWPKQDVEACVALFIEPSKVPRSKDARVVQYNEFLRLVEDCTSTTALVDIPCQCAENLSNLSNMEGLRRRLHDFLHDQSRGVGTRGRDIALHAFESADKMRSPTSATSGYLNERDFFTVLRSVGAGISPAEKQLILHSLAQAGYVTPQGIHYTSFLRQFEAATTRTLSPRHVDTSSHYSPRKATSSSSSGHFMDNICVGTYLAEYATCDERRNFELIMDTFKSLHAENVKDRSAGSTNELVYQLGPVLKVSLQFFT
ncbi:Aste57867_9693 [Aphanomyces stellatus]|uniref:Aste57867_9693 protein n=1 Tax=Aphanomyces stellatus TaxID=120398 RepID=A0A485KNJ3_9STRA|nr:hypothetical protein As57867_009655 [Aphanomyces stellatus]VFT86572.1 Aste57867_9693 [Aphanomyces stellatus]